MANQIKIKRGLEADRSGVTPASGEPLVTTDEKKLFIGDGSTPGGNAIQIDNDNVADNALSGNKVDGGTISNFASTGIDDNATSTQVTVSDTGIDVTGSVTADGLTVDGATRVNDSEFLIADNDTATTAKISMDIDTTNGARIRTSTNGGADIQPLGVYTGNTLRQKYDTNGDISFYEDTGTTASLVWDASLTSMKLTGRETSRSNNTYAFEIDNSAHTSNVTSAGAFNIIGKDGDSLTVDGKGDVSFYDDSGTAKFYWDASAESLGIGTSSPQAELDIQGGAHTTLIIGSGGNTSGDVQSIEFRDRYGTTGFTNGQIGAFIKQERDGSMGNYDLTFGTNFGTSTNATERMRIDSSGNLLVGTTDSDVTNNTTGSGINLFPGGTIAAASTSYCLDLNRTNSTVGEVARFRKQATQTGSITVTASATQYNTASDYRLKTDVQPMTGATERLKALKPVNFEWIADGTRVDGFLAHEAQEVVPEAVTGTKDAVDAEGNPEYQGIDQSKMTPLVVKCLQEAIERIESLEAELAALKD